MSCVVLPSPLPAASSGSLLLREERITPGLPQLSAAVTAATASSMRWFGGHRLAGLRDKARDGGSVSDTATWKLQAVAVPLAGVAVEVTSVVPTGKNEPDAGDVVTTPQ